MIGIILKSRNRVNREPFTAAYTFPGRGRHGATHLKSQHRKPEAEQSQVHSQLDYRLDPVSKQPKAPGRAAHTFNLSTNETEAGESLRVQDCLVFKENSRPVEITL